MAMFDDDENDIRYPEGVKTAFLLAVESSSLYWLDNESICTNVKVCKKPHKVSLVYKEKEYSLTLKDMQQRIEEIENKLGHFVKDAEDPVDADALFQIALFGARLFEEKWVEECDRDPDYDRGDVIFLTEENSNQ